MAGGALYDTDRFLDIKLSCREQMLQKVMDCDPALAEEYLKVVRGICNQQPFYVTDEDGEETGEIRKIRMLLQISVRLTT